MELIIDKRFCGPPNSGNGGYSAGILDNCTPYISEITLRVPPPLDKPLEVKEENGIYRVFDGGTLIAEAKKGSIEFSAPKPPSFEEAKRVGENFPVHQHPFNTCFVCGPKRTDGLHLYADQLPETNLFTNSWIPADDLVDENGFVKNEFIWSALDCPGAFPFMSKGKTVLLGRMTIENRIPVKCGERCVVIGWSKGEEGRKHYSGTALYNEDGKLCAVGDAVWISI